MKKEISIIGSGPSALFLAAFLDLEKYNVTIFEKNKTAGRKFLVAGKGGFNLTHSESIDELIDKYTPTTFLKKSITSFTNQNFRDWLLKIGIPTYIGSSKRVYPKEGIKPIEVLNTILKYLEDKGVQFKFNHRFSTWDNENNIIINDKIIKSDFTVFALGGASWKVTGSDGNWLDTFTSKGIKTTPFEASNCAFKINWKSEFLKKNEGKPLKNIAIYCDSKQQKGEVVITKFGLEGNGIYGLSPQIRYQLNLANKAKIYIDFKPAFNLEKVTLKIKNAYSKNTTQILKKELKLSSSVIDLLKDYLIKEEYLNLDILSKKIKKFPLEIIAVNSLDKAISSVGGVSLTAVDNHGQLNVLKNQFCIGEMLNWDAPTGGYLIQGCVSSGVSLANCLNKLS